MAVYSRAIHHKFKEPRAKSIFCAMNPWMKTDSCWLYFPGCSWNKKSMKFLSIKWMPSTYGDSRYKKSVELKANWKELVC